MDHFYTPVEERERQEIRGKPVGVDPKGGKGRGVIFTSKKYSAGGLTCICFHQRHQNFTLDFIA
jgi:hypothetical protein